ncbi:Rossmann-like and DUF2520 domain-containing protein [Aquimarina brevivitae]|uniref:Putative short-subunit dehydrogenase-like oxidoreductase (DUF2520 family) n=1 Tax=Aquimarina brevivitae TaxID=323412 RepID=A0A4Q7NTP8_9FLAO|nr:DUF2520 domain-containing protein [Aquimarina brevivitae]RZS90497.1 putative short-subunit dehydrogenase-like oxidoreductase (DUF2520 family) [Aquimarina brevivitae]
MTKVTLIGAGNVASHLFTALSSKDDIEIVQCYNRKGIALATGSYATHCVITDLNQLLPSDVFIVAVSDDAIAEVTAQIPAGDHFVVHTSGSVSIDSIDNKHRKGVFYPLQSFSKHKEITFSDVPFCLEAEHQKDYDLLSAMAKTLSKKVYKISSEQRSTLHVAAVFANNFSNFMFTIANELCTANDIPFEILHPLITETAEKVLTLSPEKSQTGPAIRKDSETIRRHLEQISNLQYKEIYKIITEAIQDTYGKEL